MSMLWKKIEFNKENVMIVIVIGVWGRALVWFQGTTSVLFFWQFIVFKACVCYFLSKFYLSPNDSPSKNMKNVFYFIKKALFILKIFKFLYFHLPLFFSLSATASVVGPRKILKVYDSIDCISKNLFTHFFWYVKKEIGC